MAEKLPSDDAARFLASRYGDRASSLELIGAGEWSRAYAFSLDGKEAIIRFGDYGEDFAKDAFMGALATPGIPIPRVLDMGEAARGLLRGF
jgi:hygromycin-B 4-O-kinase